MRALVLGGGGITGIAWELGLLAGLRRLGTDLTEADLIVGTSAGAYVGALLATGADIDEAADAAARIEIEFTARIDPMLAAQGFMLLNDTTLSPRDLRARLGTLARQAPLGDDAPHVARFADQLPAHDWPTTPRLIVTAVDTTTGDPTAWDAASAVPLPAAVAASCALPGVFPPVRVGESWYMDGGVHSVTHANLATDADTVVVVAPSGGMFRASPAAEMADLGIDRSMLIAPDAPTRSAIGGNVLDPRRRGPALAAGAAQAEHVSAAVADIWN
ncbi:patatin-like phospholipase family protein [Actinoplanes sp. NPDC049316]|uniref:patatin-like phospholipase family protein n=1 Tax=Actinoplanes sp. NPDC049316 TaxID=3154727 RepID=UPI00343D4352